MTWHPIRWVLDCNHAHWSPTGVVQLERVDVDGVACGRKLLDVLHIFEDESVVTEESSMCVQVVVRVIG